MCKLRALVLALCMSVLPAVAQPQVDIYGANGNVQGSITNTTTTIPNTSTTVTLTAASRHIILVNSHTTTIVYVDLNNATATSADFAVGPGCALTYEGPAITSFKILGSAASGNYSVLAW